MLNVIHNFWVIQAIGAVGLAFSILAWNSRTRKNMLNLQSVNCFLFVIHYVLLGAFAGAIMSGVVLIRNFVFVRKDEKKWANHKAWIYVFIVCSLVGLLLSWKGWISILPAIGVIVGTYAVSLDSPAKIRFYMLITNFIWIPYTLVVHSYPGFISQIVGIIGTTLGMYRLDRLKNKAE